MDLTCASNPFLRASLSDSVALGPSLFSHAKSPFELTTLSTVFLYILGLQSEVSGVITNVSVIQSWNWFFHLSPFESVLLFFVIALIGVLEIVGILPINMTEFWAGNSAGRRKRRHAKFSSTQSSSEPPHVALAMKDIGAKLLILYKKLDKNECGFRALCELQKKVTHDSANSIERKQDLLSKPTHLVLAKLHSFAQSGPGSYQERSNQRHEFNDGDESANNSEGSGVDIKAALQPYIEAVKIGSEFGKSPSHGCNYLYRNSSICNSTSNACEEKYSSCPVTSEEVLGYVDQINLLLQY